AGYLRSDILDAANPFDIDADGHSKIKHIAINAKDPEFEDAAKAKEHNESIRDSYNKTNLEKTELYKANRAAVEAEFDAILRQDTITVKDISDADKRLNIRLVDNMPDYARIFPEVPVPDSVRARILAEQKIWQSNPDNPKAAVEKIKGEAKTEIEALERQIFNDFNDPDLFDPDGKRPITLQDYHDTAARKSIQSKGVEQGVKDMEARLQKIYIAVKAAAPDVVTRVQQDVTNLDVDEQLDRINSDGKSSSFVKAGAAVSVLSAFLAGLAVYTKYRADTVEDPQALDEYLARLGPGLIASSGALAGLIGGALFVAAVVPGGSLFVLGLGLAGGYTAFKEFLQNYVDAYRDREDDPLPDPNAHFESAEFNVNDDGDFSNDDFTVNLARNVLLFMETLENSAIGKMVSAVAELLTDNVIKPYFEALTPSISIVDGYQVKQVDKDGGWLVGEDVSYLVGNEENDVLFHFGSGKVFGRAGDDWLVSYGPDYITAGEYLLESDRDKAEANKSRSEGDQLEITGPVAEKDYRLELDGGEGDDNLVVLGGTGAVTLGGPGRDFLFNTSFKGQMYGDTIDGVGQSTSGTTDSDVFWYWPSTFIMDAQPNDILQMFGWPLLGGSNSVAGIYA
ncbi:MAG: hypothetical protein GY761_11430, partial [Hyphomicrobiales bacterium]|nr:hypothetical protein [Hyphomicrobiales bacterium]